MVADGADGGSCPKPAAYFAQWGRSLAGWLGAQHHLDLFQRRQYQNRILAQQRSQLDHHHAQLPMQRVELFLERALHW